MKILFILLPLLLLTGCMPGDVSETWYLDDLELSGELVLTDTVWDDLRAPVNQGKLKGTADPTWTDAVGGQVLLFPINVDKEIYFILQFPHDYAEGTDIVPHVHWCYAANLVGGSVRWGMEYWWLEEGQVIGGSDTIYALTPAANNDALTLYRTSLPGISGTGHKISSILNCRIFRDADDVSDNYSNNAYLLEFDIHYQKDGLGSAEELVK